MSDREFYAPPEGGWLCFHCGERFTTVGGARDHFGFTQSSDPACRIKLGAERGLVMALRKAEEHNAELLNKLHDESSEVARAYSAAASRHGEQLRIAEELGYERGLRDAIRQNLEIGKTMKG
jgi:hypothetical protein